MKDLEARAYALIQWVAAKQEGEIAVTVRESRLTPAQYNVLGVLRGAGAEGLGCNAIADRMVSRDPDMTRLLDKLEARDLVTRTRSAADRRVVSVRITPAGLAEVARLDEPMALTHEEQFRRLDEAGLRKLVELLETVS